MGIVSWIIFGLVAGFLAKKIMPGDGGPSGCLMTSILGIAGSVVGGFIGSKVMDYEYQNWSWVGMGWAVGGAILILFIFGRGKKK